MCAFPAKDGKQFSMASRMRAHNMSQDAKQKKAPGAILEAPGEPDGDEGAEDGAAIAAEHGPAHHVELEHDHEAGRHTVRSEHPDGHQHESSHHTSVEEAHEHAKKLAGGGMEEHARDEEPDGDEAEY